MKSKKRLVVFVCALVALLSWWTTQAVREHLTYVDQLEKYRAQEFHRWITTQRGMARHLDQALAEVLVAADEAALRTALETATERAYAAREALWPNSPLSGVDTITNRWDYRKHYERMGSYLHYLTHRERSGLLTGVEVENVLLIRSCADLLRQGFNDLSARVQYQTETFLRYYPWRQIKEDQQILAILENLGLQLNLQDEIGGQDSAFRAHLDQWIGSRPWPNYRIGLIHTGEATLDESARLDRARAFLSTFVAGEVVDGGRHPVNEQGQSESVAAPISGGGEDHMVGGYTMFALRDSASQWRYEVGVTEIGGHILRLELRSSEIASPEEVLQLAEKAIEHWAAFEGLTLTLVQDHRHQESIQRVYALVIDDITYVDLTLSLFVILHRSIELDASRFWSLYNSEVGTLRPQLSAQEAIALLSPHLVASGEPRLEARGHALQLSYAIPVTGVERVSTIYINAVTGQYEKMEYN